MDQNINLHVFVEVIASENRIVYDGSNLLSCRKPKLFG